MLFGSGESKMFPTKAEQYADIDGQGVKLKVGREELLKLVKKRVYPSYPPEAVAIKTMPGFSILVAVEVNSEGKVMHARSIEGPSILQDAAVTAAKLWEFAPIADKNYSSVSGVINFMAPDERVQWKGESGLDHYVDEFRQNPSSWLAHCRLATAYLIYKQPTKAIEEYEKSLALQPGVPEVLYGLGMAYRDIDQPVKALPYFQKALQNKPGFVEAIYPIAGIYRNNGQTAEAIDSFLQAIKIRPNDLGVKEIVYTNLYSIYEKLGQIDEAIQMLEESVKVDIEISSLDPGDLAPDPVFDLEKIANHYEKKERYEEAIKTYQRIVDFEPISPAAFRASIEMASLHKKLGRRSETLAICQRWLDYMDKNPVRNSQGEADEMRGRIYMEMDRHQDAILYFKKAAAKKPSNSIRPNEYLYDLYLKVGNLKEAAKQDEIIKKFYDEWERPMREGRVIRVKP